MVSLFLTIYHTNYILTIFVGISSQEPHFCFVDHLFSLPFSPGFGFPPWSTSQPYHFRLPGVVLAQHLKSHHRWLGAGGNELSARNFTPRTDHGPMDGLDKTWHVYTKHDINMVGIWFIG